MNEASLHGDDTYRYANIRLNFSSNVYNHFDHTRLFAHLAERMACIGSYPEPEPYALEAMIAAQAGIPADCVMVTNGATEAIYLIAQAYRGATSLIVQPTFAEYEEACRKAGHNIIHHPIPTTSIIPPWEERGGSHPTPDLIWMCNPNNPTGLVTPEETLFNLPTEERQKAILILDHSYAKFTEQKTLTPPNSCLGGTGATTLHSSLFILHSMTKEYAIPGLRLGYVMGNAQLLQQLRDLRMPWSVNSLAIEAGKYLLQHRDDYLIDVHGLMLERRRVAAALTATGCIDVMPSDTHILLCRLHNGSAPQLKERLATENGILIRDASNFHGLDKSYFRIAVQTKKENDELINILSSLVVQLT